MTMSILAGQGAVFYRGGVRGRDTDDDPDGDERERDDGPNGGQVGGGNFANGALSGTFSRAFNDEASNSRDTSDRTHRIFAVAHRDSPDDFIGHAFVILTDADGVQYAYGFWPAELVGQKGFINGREYKGVVLDESTTGYLERYNEWRRTGLDPRGGEFRSKMFPISSLQFDKAMVAISTFKSSWGIRCGCGTFAVQVVSATGNRIGPAKPYYLPNGMLFSEFSPKLYNPRQ